MNTLFDKIWDAHVVTTVEDGPTQLYIDRLYCHEVTSPQAFAGLRARGIKCFRPEKIYCMPDHNTPTHDQDKPIEDPVSKTQVDTLTKNAKDFGLTHFGMMDKRNGIIHVVGPERGLTLPGMTIVCGDSHTSTHGAMGAVAFGIGTSEVEMVLASQCILQSRPKTMRITVDGKPGEGVTAKDIALYMMSKMTTSGATGYFVEYAGAAFKKRMLPEMSSFYNSMEDMLSADLVSSLSSMFLNDYRYNVNEASLLLYSFISPSLLWSRGVTNSSVGNLYTISPMFYEQTMALHSAEYPAINTILTDALKKSHSY